MTRPIVPATIAVLPPLKKRDRGGFPHSVLRSESGFADRIEARAARHGWRECGFTLVELVVSIILIGIISGLGAQMLGRTFEIYALGRDSTSGDWQGRLALERVTRDLRMARGRTNLTIVPATAMTFSDMDGNNVSYALAGSQLQRNGRPLADDISALQFTYLRSDGLTAEAADPNQVYYVTVAFNVTRAGLAVPQRATVRPRGFWSP